MNDRLRDIAALIRSEVGTRPLRRSTVVLSAIVTVLTLLSLTSFWRDPYLDGDTWWAWSTGGAFVLRLWEPSGRPRFSDDTGRWPLYMFWGIPNGNYTYAWIFHLRIAYYPIILPFAVPLVVRSLAVVRSWLTWRPGTCRGCGYDLRASPTRCPECGLPNPASA